jgi:hypothetical protein
VENYFDFLLVDPRPDLEDSRLWERILRIIPLIESDVERKEQLHKNLWSFRCYGTYFKRQAGGGWMLCPELGPRCAFDSDEEFIAAKDNYLRPFAREINQVMRKVDGYE